MKMWLKETSDLFLPAQSPTAWHLPRQHGSDEEESVADGRDDSDVEDDKAGRSDSLLVPRPHFQLPPDS